MEKMLVDVVASVADVAVYHDFAPEQAALPLVIVQRVGGDGWAFVGEVADDVYQVRFFVSVWDRSRLDALDLSRKIERALCARENVRALGAGVSLADADTGKRGVGQDFLVWGI